MSDKQLTIDQKIQIARMATDIVIAEVNVKKAAGNFSKVDNRPVSDHELYIFVFNMIKEQVTGDKSDSD